MRARVGLLALCALFRRLHGDKCSEETAPRRRARHHAQGLRRDGPCDFGAKRLQLLKKAFPHIAHAGLLFESANLGSVAQVHDLAQAAVHLKIRVIPIEQPTKFELIVNMSTAKAIGMKFPQSIVARAERLIE